MSAGGDIFIAAISSIPSTIAAGAAVIAARRGTDNAKALIEVRTVGQQIATQTNGELDAKIKRVVVEVFKEHRGEVTEAVMAESVRHLLNALINADDFSYPQENI